MFHTPLILIIQLHLFPAGVSGAWMERSNYLVLWIPHEFRYSKFMINTCSVDDYIMALIQEIKDHNYLRILEEKIPMPIHLELKLLGLLLLLLFFKWENVSRCE